MRPLVSLYLSTFTLYYWQCHTSSSISQKSSAVRYFISAKSLRLKLPQFKSKAGLDFRNRRQEIWPNGR